MAAPKKPEPTNDDIDALLRFLPALTAPGFDPVLEWPGRTVHDEAMLLTPHYAPVVVEFYETASAPCWQDQDYVPEVAHAMLLDHRAVARASMSEVVSMLTFCVRGERFYEGHWAGAITEGHIERLLRRLARLRDAPDRRDQATDES